MATGWLKGTVKAVPSGDSLLVMGSVKGGPPPEKTITLAGLIAPKLARRDGRDEPFAWDSREYLRKKCIGKEVTFKVDYVVPSINREFGTVIMGGQNVAYDVVADGWAKVRQQGGQNNEVKPELLQELNEREMKAQTEGYGIWTKEPGASEASIRDLPPSAIGDSSGFDALGLVESSKGKALPAIVEAVRDGSTVRVYLLPDFQYVQVYCAGVQAPSMGRRSPMADILPSEEAKASNGESKTGEAAGEAAAPMTTAQRLAASNSAAAQAEILPDPYAKEAKHFTEVRVLNRDVRIVLEGADKFNNLIGSVHYPDGDSLLDLSLELVKQGFVKVVEWSANMMEEDAKRKLKAAELQAKKDRLKIWTTYVPPQTNSTAILDVNFSGKVIEVVSGDCVVVADDAAPYGSPAAERRVNLSSIRAPRIGNPKKEEKPAAYAREAKEYLRNLLIGQQVNVTMEYSRKIGAMDGPIPAAAAPGSDRTMDFGSVFLVSAPKGEAADTTLPALAVPGQPQGTNIAEMLVVRGFATVVRHRDFEERSNYYEALLAAESKAIKGKKKIHSQKESPVTHINDLSLPGSTKKAIGFLPFLQRQRRLPAIVDYVLSGHRFKLLIPKETCGIAFSLSGVRCPGRGEPYSEEAIAFMRRRILQRDVEIEIEAVDKTGTFLGSLWEGKENVSIGLLEAGLAKLHPSFSTDRVTEGHLLLRAEESAKKKNLKAWEGFVEGEAEANKAAAAGAKALEAKAVPVVVTDVLGGGKFYVQTEEARVAAIQKTLEGLRLKDKPMVQGMFVPQKGDTVIAQFSSDNSWNRALIVNAPRQSGAPTAKSEYEVFYIDYGNQEMVPLSRLRPLDPSVSSPAQGLAMLCSLAHIRVPELEEDCGEEAAEFLSDCVANKPLLMKVEEKDTSGGKVKGKGTGPRSIVTLIEPESSRTIQSLMLENGLAKLEKVNRWDGPEKKKVHAELEEFLSSAKKNRLNMWSYGDVESDEEDTPRRPMGRR
ncbi:hypothetical protein KC19_7G168000 [Ceratodon purpureus]|uniref:Ribonuclease n=1 Tax=Ceratodon purpureus TaxID=3225 RepID=A0A8T0HB23_CERPU|nr:hypothetical protein KC19_7G168000 [Ceratodon purpureus]